MGNYELSKPLHEEALEIRRKLLGDEHLDTMYVCIRARSSAVRRCCIACRFIRASILRASSVRLVSIYTLPVSRNASFVLPVTHARLLGLHLRVREARVRQGTPLRRTAVTCSYCQHTANHNVWHGGHSCNTSRPPKEFHARPWTHACGIGAARGTH